MAETIVHQPPEEQVAPFRYKIRNKFYLPLPGVTDPKDLAAILALFPKDHPLHIALTGGGAWLAEPKGRAPLAFPIRRISLSSLAILPATFADEGLGLTIRLTDDLARLIHAWEAIQEGMSYRWERLIEEYTVDLGRECGRRMRRLLAARIDGIAAQVVPDPRCKRGEVHLSPKAAETMLRKLQKRYPELNLQTVADMDGLRVVLQRFPVMGNKGCRWVTLRVVNGLPSRFIFVNAVDWNKLHGGDDDGDLGYIGIPRNSAKVTKVPVARVPAWPEFRFKNHGPVIDELLAGWEEKGTDDKVKVVTNFFTKDCIGPQVYMICCLARAAGFEYARALGTAGDRRTALARITRGIFKANAPLAERTFDGKKSVGDALGEFLAVVDTFQDAVGGKPFTAEPFYPFLEDDEQRGLLAHAIKMAGGSLRSCRSTGYGCIVAAGRKITGMVTDRRTKKLVPRAGQIVDRLLRLSIEPDDLMDRLMEDALGIRFLELPRNDNTWDRPSPEKVTEDMDEPEEEEEESGEEAPGPQILVSEARRGIQALLLSVQSSGQSVFSNIRVERREEGDLVVTARLREAWGQGAQKSWLVEMVLPDVSPKHDITPDGHRKVEAEGIKPRLWLPRFIWLGKDVALQSFDVFLANLLAGAVMHIRHWMDAAEVNEDLGRLIRKGLNGLPTWADEEIAVRMAEFELGVVDTGSLRTNWENREAALQVLADNGFDVCTTSKNAPGTIVTRSWKRGIPRHLFALNPFVPCLDLKRRPEGRERRLAMPLFAPQPPSVVSRGTKVPAEMQKSQTELVCVVGDVPGYSTWLDDSGEEFGHDTGIVLPCALEKLALARLEFQCGSHEEVDDLIGRLLEAGVGIDAIRVERNSTLLGEGMAIDSFQLLVEAKVTDWGKIKACVGPFKFVTTPIPHRLFAINPDGSRTEIDVILPAHTVRKKKALDALLYMLAARAGIAEIDPEFSPEEVLLEIRVALRQQWRKKKPPTEAQLERLLNGMQPIVVVNPDGSEQQLGFATVGVLPFYRPVQTAFSQFKVRTGENGIKVQTHAMLMAEGIEYDVPVHLKEEFADVVKVRRAMKSVSASQSENSEGGWFDEVMAGLEG